MEFEIKATNRNKRATLVTIVTFYSVLCTKRNEATNRNKRATPVIIITFYEAKQGRYTCKIIYTTFFNHEEKQAGM